MMDNSGDTFETWCDQIEVTSNLPYLDPRWEWTDPNGHHHTAKGDTFTFVVDEPGGPDGDGGEYPDEGHYECKVCRVHVVPGITGPDMYRRFIPGMIHVSINGREVSKAEADAWLAKRHGGHVQVSASGIVTFEV